MQLDKEIFEHGDPTQGDDLDMILAFLENEPDTAFDVQEIIENLAESRPPAMDAGWGLKLMVVLSQRGQVVRKVIRGRAFYMIAPDQPPEEPDGSSDGDDVPEPKKPTTPSAPSAHGHYQHVQQPTA